ncbi:MAG: hypothetical protein N2167_07945 [Flavobacteriales bacterium]|nr:hypothetical protein [Flavobacteriales bacterium]
MKLRIVIFFMLISSILVAQPSDKDLKKGFRYNNYFELSGLVSPDLYGGTGSWSHYHNTGKKKKNFKIGYGTRITSVFGIDRNYVTAPAKLTRGVTGPIAVFSERQLDNYDTIYLARPQVNSLNLYFSIQYTLFRRFDLGLNADLAGVSFGTKEIAEYTSSKNNPGEFSQAQRAYPTGFNLMLLGDNNIGSLNSEVFARFWITNQWAVKASLNFVFTEYTTVNTLRLGNDRFRDRSFMAGVAVTFCPWRSEIFYSDKNK